MKNIVSLTALGSTKKLRTLLRPNVLCMSSSEFIYDTFRKVNYKIEKNSDLN